MLGSEYAMKYSMPHSVVHIVDNSAYQGALPTVIADDPSLYATLVVTGAPMGPDNEIISINRSDVLNVAFGMNNLSPADIKKYGQTVTYPASLLSQNAPIKFMRVTPEDSTYAFSCLLVQWRWDGNMMHVRFKTTADNGNNGLPPGVILSSFKNVERLNTALVNGFKMDGVEDTSDGTTWTQRVFMTSIAAGRGKVYNFYNYAINLTSQTRRPANTRYLFSTIDTRVSQVVEQFFASLVNENNSLRTDAINSVNVEVGRRVKGSSIIVPKVNELAVKELYAEYMQHLKEMIDNGIAPTYGVKDMKFVEDVYKTMNVNIFEPIYGRYIYNGDDDVRLPYYQVEMVDLNIPQLDTANRIKTVLGGSEAPATYILNPTDLQEVLNARTYGIMDSSNEYHVGDVFCNAPTSLALSMITSINQYSGSVTTIPITSVYTDENHTATDIFRAFTMVKADDADTVKAAVQDLVNRKKLNPRATDDGVKNDFVLIGLPTTSEYNKLSLFGIAEVTYTNVTTVANVTLKTEKSDIYNMFVYPSDTVTAFAVNVTKKSEEDKPVQGAYRYTPGSTVVFPDTGEIKVNKYNSTEPTQDDPDEKQFDVVTKTPFVIGVAPKKVASNTDLVGMAYDDMIYDTGDGLTIKWKLVGGTPWVPGTATDPHCEGYVVGDIVQISSSNDPQPGNTFFKITRVTPNISEEHPTWQTVEIERFMDSAYGEADVKLVPGEYTTDETKKWVVYTTADPSTFDPSAHFRWDATTCDFVAGDPIPAEPGEDTPTPEGEYGKCTWYDVVTDNVGTGLIVSATADDIVVSITPTNANPTYIQRYNITGTQGSLFRYQINNTEIPSNYYSEGYGKNPNSANGGIALENGYAGFLDDDISEIEFKWRYSNLLVKAYRGEKDPRITSPTRCPAKYLFDGGTNTIVGQTILPYMKYNPVDIINASTIYTEDEKEAILLNNTLIDNITEFVDVDVKQAMYDLMVIRVYDGIPEDKRPIGPGSGLSLHLDAGVTDANTATLINQSFAKRFDNPNASWDIGGYVSAADGIAYTYIKKLVDGMFSHMRQYTVNKPYTGKYTNIGPTEYSSFFPDIDTTDWELRELLYNSGGNAWIMDINGNLQRQSQRCLNRGDATSDLVQESNMRTLSQLTYLLQNKINSYLLEYNDDGVLNTLKDEVDNMFSNWVGTVVQDLEIIFKRDINPTDGGEIVVCYVNVTFRGLILRVPIIVNVQRRTTSE